MKGCESICGKMIYDWNFMKMKFYFFQIKQEKKQGKFLRDI